MSLPIIPTTLLEPDVYKYKAQLHHLSSQNPTNIISHNHIQITLLNSASLLFQEPLLKIPHKPWVMARTE